MIVSMTGFGKALVDRKGISVQIEVKSVNHRYFELYFHLPRRYNSKEEQIRAIVKEFIKRGKVHITAAISSEIEEPSIQYNISRAREYYSALVAMAKHLGINQQVQLEHLLRWNDLFEKQEPMDVTPQEWRVFTAALRKALKELVKQRLREGKSIAKDIQARFKRIAQMLSMIEKIAREQVPKFREELRRKIAQIVDTAQLDQERLEMEIALYADRIDVTEECVRLQSHLNFAQQLMTSQEREIGRQLNFLLQEILRETNTIGAKANDANISQFVVKMKEEIEKIREQVQNVE